MDPNKKISFGFNKLARKPVVVRTQTIEEKKVELVECLEGQSIKIKNAVEIIKKPLIIPIKDNQKNLLDRVKEAKAKQRELTKSEIKQEDNRPDSELTLEEQAARALINDAKNRLENNTVSNSKVTVLPFKEDQLIIDGEKEPTLEDYENIPISDYGMAMLRGMGWKEGMGIGKDLTKTAAPTVPELRPKGLGLGATKIIKTEEPARDKEGNALILKKGCFAKIIAGSHKGSYCEVLGFDDEAGRVIVRTSLKGEILTLNEFLIVLVTKEEYSQGAKVLNNAKYEEYKEISDKKLEAHRKVKGSIKEEKYSDSEPGEQSNSKSKYNRKEKVGSSFQKKEQSSRHYSRDYDDSLSSDNESKRKSRESDTFKSGNKSRGDINKYKDKYDRHQSKYRDKQVSNSDSDDKYEKLRSRNRDRSDSDSGSRKKKSKDKKKKKDRHRDRSRSRKDKQKSDKKSESKNRNRSPSYDHKKRESNKTHKSKSKHRRRSDSSSSDGDYRSRK